MDHQSVGLQSTGDHQGLTFLKGQEISMIHQPVHVFLWLMNEISFYVDHHYHISFLFSYWWSTYYRLVMKRQLVDHSLGQPVVY